MASQAFGKVNVVSSKFEFKWEIDKFCLSCKNVGDSLESPKFRAYSPVSSEVQWYLTLYPNGVDKNAENYLSIYLYAVADDIKASCVFKFLDDKNKVVKSMNLEERTFGSWGFNKCLSRDFIMNPANRMLNVNTMTIACEITMSAVDKDEATELDNQALEQQEVDVLSPLKVIDKFEALLNDSTFSDISLVSESKAVKAHKCILAKSSSVFAAMFDAEMKERQENTVEIDDIKYDVLVEMIRFVYSGKVKNFETLVCELAVAADKYGLDELKDMCEKMIMENLNLDNVFDCLQLAVKLDMKKLKLKAIEFIVEKGSDATDKPEFELLPSDIMCKVSRGLANKSK